MPVITHQGHLRDSITLVRVELTPLSKALRGSWRETCEKCLEVLRRCICVDKDLVLPPMESSGAVETFFIVASTDMERVSVMMDRIHDQIGALPKLKASGTMRVAAEKLPASSTADPRTLEEQVWGVADCVTEIIQQSLCSKQDFTEKEKHTNAN
jgi:hypothetical protein